MALQSARRPGLQLVPMRAGEPAQPDDARTTPKASIEVRLFSALLREFRHVLPPTLFFFVGFHLIAFTKQLILAQYQIKFTGFMIATVAALVVGKAVLVADKMPFMRRFDRAPLIQPVLFKTTVYWGFVFIARLLESFVRFTVMEGHSPSGFLEEMQSDFSWHQFIAVQLWIFVLFLLYVIASELNTLFGDGEMWRLFFTRRASELQMNRRQRLRELIHLSRLADKHTVDVFRDPNSEPHRELVDIIQRLARQHWARGSAR